MEDKLFTIKYTSQNPYQQEIDLDIWCREQAKLYREGKLSSDKIAKLESIGFDWNYYRD